MGPFLVPQWTALHQHTCRRVTPSAASPSVTPAPPQTPPGSSVCSVHFHPHITHCSTLSAAATTAIPPARGCTRFRQTPRQPRSTSSSWCVWQHCRGGTVSSGCTPACRGDLGVGHTRAARLGSRLGQDTCLATPGPPSAPAQGPGVSSHVLFDFSGEASPI